MARERLFSIEEIACALEVSEKTILRRIETKQLKARQYGGTRWIPQKSLRGWILRAVAILGRRPTCRKIKHNGINLLQYYRQRSVASGYRLRETMDTSKPRGKLSKPATAAVELGGSFRYFARRFAPKDLALQDDLVQEMSLAVLACEQSANRSFFITRAKSKALNYLEHERLRGMTSLSEVTCRQQAEQPVRDDALLKLLKMAGIPVAVIARGLGIAISPDVGL